MSNGLRALPKNGAAADTRIVQPHGNMVLLRDIRPESTIFIPSMGMNDLESKKLEPMLMKIEALSDEYEKPVKFKVGDLVIATNIGVPCELYGLNNKLYLTHASSIAGSVSDP
jgi:hypothetical protein